MIREVNGCALCPMRHVERERGSARGASWCLGVQSKQYPHGRELLANATRLDAPIAPQWCPAEDGLVLVLRRARHRLDDKRCCPKCGATQMEETTMGWTGGPELNPNRFTCRCGWKGKWHELAVDGGES